MKTNSINNSIVKKVTELPELREISLKFRLDQLNLSRKIKSEKEENVKINTEVRKSLLSPINLKSLQVENNRHNFKIDLFSTNENKTNFHENSFNSQNYPQKSFKINKRKSTIDSSVKRKFFTKEDLEKVARTRVFLSPLAKIKILLQKDLKTEESVKENEKSYQKPHKINNQINLIKEDHLKQSPKHRKRGIVLYHNTLSPERKQNIKEMRNFQIYGKSKKTEMSHLVNPKILENERKLNNSSGMLDESVSQNFDDIQTIFINDQEQLIKKYLLPKKQKPNLETISLEGRKFIKLSKCGNLKLDQLCNTENHEEYFASNHNESGIYFDHSFAVK